MIRALRPEDLGAVSVLLRRLRGDGLYTERAIRHRIESAPERAGAAWWVADDAGVVAYAVAMRRWWRASNTGYAWVAVAPEARGRGIGSALWEAAEQHAATLGVESLLSDVFEDAAGEAFLEARGFRPGRRDRVSALDPRTADLGELQQREHRAAADGYRVIALRTLDDQRALYELDLEASDDMPGSDAARTFSFEEWRRERLDDPDLDRDAGAITLHDSRPVALALLSIDPEGRRAHNDQTGVTRAHRRRGLATLMKLTTIRWAREHGIEQIITENTEDNAAMLAINNRLGYQPFVTRQRWVRDGEEATAGRWC